MFVEYLQFARLRVGYLLVVLVLCPFGRSEDQKPNAVSVKPHALFSSNMVFQRSKPIHVFGTAAAGGILSVTFNNQTVTTLVGTDGMWEVELNAVETSGGPYELIIAGKQKKVMGNIMIGDVWLCSGQSNMTFSVNEALNPVKEAADANFPEIRYFSVNKDSAELPQDDVIGKWVVCSDKRVRGFSAVAYFFAKNLYKSVKIPLGIIHSSWPGTPGEAWMKFETINNDPELKPIINRYTEGLRKVKREVRQRYEENLAIWQKMQKEGKKEHKDPGNTGFAKGWAKPDFVDAQWKTMSVPGRWEKLLDMDGSIWFRKEVVIPESWAGSPLVLHLSTIDDFDTTYFNGVEIGQTGPSVKKHWQVKRAYIIPASLVKVGRAVIAVRIFDCAYGGGFSGSPKEMKLVGKDSEIQLAGDWKFEIEHQFVSISHPKPYFSLSSSPARLFNAMIYPLSNFPLKGFVWYQGESNTSRAYQYRTLLKLLINDWRILWRQEDLPFIVVQLANFNKPNSQPSDSSWAELREAQLLATELNNVGIATAVDLGEAKNIHPKNKQDLGRRVALVADNLVYGKDIVSSGPRFTGMEITGDKIILTFSDLGGGLKVKGDTLRGFAIAGADRKFVWAEAYIEGSKVIVQSKNVTTPVAVRYAWADNPVEANLYNEAGLPAFPFRTDDWSGLTYHAR